MKYMKIIERISELAKKKKKVQLQNSENGKTGMSVKINV